MRTPWNPSAKVVFEATWPRFFWSFLCRNWKPRWETSQIRSLAWKNLTAYLQRFKVQICWNWSKISGSISEIFERMHMQQMLRCRWLTASRRNVIDDKRFLAENCVTPELFLDDHSATPHFRSINQSNSVFCNKSINNDWSFDSDTPAASTCRLDQGTSMSSAQSFWCKIAAAVFVTRRGSFGARVIDSSEKKNSTLFSKDLKKELLFRAVSPVNCNVGILVGPCVKKMIENRKLFELELGCAVHHGRQAWWARN